MTKNGRFLCFVGLIAFLSSGCRGLYTDVSNDPKYRKYNSLIGSEFKSKTPQYLVKLDPENSYVSMYTRREIGIPGLEDVKEFPYKSGSEVIYGILPVGSTYRITHAIRRNSSTAGGVDWRGVITNTGPFQGMMIRTNKVISPEIYGPHAKYEDVEEGSR